MATDTLEYEYEVVYIQGSNNNNADALIRIHVTEGCIDSQDNKSELTKEERQAIFQRNS